MTWRKEREKEESEETLHTACVRYSGGSVQVLSYQAPISQMTNQPLKEENTLML